MLQRAYGSSQDATENDPQSRRETQVFRVREGSIPPEKRTIVAGGEPAAKAREPSGVCRLRPSRAPVRPAGAAALRVRSLVGTGGGFRVPHAGWTAGGVGSRWSGCRGATDDVV